MSNWYFECPFCEEEIGCDVDENVAPDGSWLSTCIPNECIECGEDLTERWNELDERIREHYMAYHSEPPEKEWFEDVDFSPLGALYFEKSENDRLGQR